MEFFCDVSYKLVDNFDKKNLSVHYGLHFKNIILIKGGFSVFSGKSKILESIATLLWMLSFLVYMFTCIYTKTVHEYFEYNSLLVLLFENKPF